MSSLEKSGIFKKLDSKEMNFRKKELQHVCKQWLNSEGVYSLVKWNEFCKYCDIFVYIKNNLIGGILLASLASSYQCEHPSCNSCPICRSLLNLIEIEPFSNYALTYEEFIKLDGICVHGSYILIKMNSSNWKDLLKNLLVLITISQHHEYVENVNRTKLFIKGTGRDMTFGFILEDVQFLVQKSIDKSISISKPKIVLSEISDIQFQNLKHLDNILLEITNNNSNEYSLIKQKRSHDDDFDTIITSDNAKIITGVYPFTRQYDVANRAPCNYEDYLRGKCCIALIPEVVTIHNNTYYQLKCIDFALINGIKNNKIKNNKINRDKKFDSFFN